jgi:hypothetical protein
MEVFEENICSKESYGFINYVRFICNRKKNQCSCIGGSKPSIVLSVDRIPGSEVGAGPFI